MTQIIAKIELREDTEANWISNNPILGKSEHSYSTDVFYGSTNQKKFKVGNGLDHWSDLDYMPINPVDLQAVTDLGANTTNQMQINGINVATVNDIPSLSGYEQTVNKTDTVVGNETSSIKYPSIKGLVVWVTNLFVKKGTLTSGYIPKATASDTIGDSKIFDDGTNVILPNALSKLRIANLTASQIVETDSSKNLVSVAKQTGYNLPLGTTAGTVLAGNAITQTITNGVTDKAPSEDAVFDALITKADKQNGLVNGGIITVGTYGGTGTNNDIRVAAATWFISPSNYSTAGNNDFLDITLAATGLQRYVGFYGDNTNTITMVNGAESEYAVYPSTPVGKALIGYVLVTDSAAASTPDLSGYMLISNKATMGDALLAVNDSKYVTPLALLNFSRRLGYKFSTTAVPNTTNIEILHSYLVNGIANVAGRTLDLFISTRQTSDANTKTWRVYFNTTNNLTGAVLVATLVVTTNGAYCPFQRFFHLVNNTTIFPESTSSASLSSAFINNISASPTNITVPNMNNNFYIIITCQKQLSTNTVGMDRTTLDLK